MESNTASLVLIVDDDEAECLMMATTLEQAGFETLIARDCASARKIFAEHKLDIILLDVLLPDGDGFSLCQEFLADPRGRDLPIALVTGLDDVESIRIGYQFGATDFITKPVSWGTLPYRIQYILRASLAFIDLSVSESKTRALLSAIPDTIIRIHRDGRVLDMQAGSSVSDIDDWFYFDEYDNIGRLPPSIRKKLEPTILKCLNGAGIQQLEFQWCPDPEHIRYWEARILQRNPDEVIMVVRDISQRKEQESQLRLWAKVFEGSNEAILITDADLRIISVNQAYQKIMGFTEEEVIGVDTMAVGSGLHTHSFFRNVISTLQERKHWHGELKNQRKNGEIFPCWFSISQVTDTVGAAENYIAIFTDITERKSSQAQIEFLAHHDSLTGLPNRILLNDRIEMAISDAKRHDDKVGVLFIDLDRFKNVNDSLGHTVGDLILKEAANRLTASIRNGDTVSRLGGDEFVVLFPRIKSDGALADLTIKLRETLQEAYIVDSISLHMTPSIGIAIYPDDGINPNTLIKNADAAMYLAKEKGRNNYQFYTPALNAKTLDRLKLESELRLALDQHNFELHYQPQLIGATGDVWGVEALVRWRHAERGLIPPGEFIPLAEETGLIIPLGEWVLEEAARQISVWKTHHFNSLTVSVNISALQFRQPDFLERALAIIGKAGVSANSIEFELTESVLMSDMKSSIATLNRFRELGYRIAIDDFGTGFSSLNYLRHLPIDVLKIDQSFVRDMLRDRASLAIVESIITLAHALGMETIAEGVETEEEFKVLQQRSCRLIQGFYFAKPMPAAVFEQWMQNHSKIRITR